MDYRKEFTKYAVKHRGMGSAGVDGYINSVYADYISPTPANTERPA